MSLATDPIAQALRQWILITTGLPDNKVIFSRNPGTQPQRPYVSIDPYCSIQTVGMGDEQIQQAGDTALHIQRRAIKSDVNFYGDVLAGDGYANAKLALDGLGFHSVREILNPAGISVLHRGSLANLSAVMETEFVERYQLEPVFNVVTTSIEAIDHIASVSVSGTAATPTMDVKFTGSVSET